MSKDRIFARTKQGNDLLDNPKGRISGDEMLLLALIDGQTSVEGIAKKVPPSVRIHLDAIFKRLLSAEIIDDAGNVEIDTSADHSEDVADGQIKSATQGNERDTTTKRYTNLEQELDVTRAQLEATRVRMKEAEVGFHKLRLRVSVYTELTQAKLTKWVKDMSDKATSVEGLRVIYESELREVIENLQPLNQAIADQQKILDSTLRLKVFPGKPSADQMQKEREEEEARLAQSHPNYKKLRGLEFFRGFANAELLQFLGIAKWQQAGPGDTVLGEGDIGMPFFIIVSGKVEVFKGDRKLANLEQGDFFGEFAYLSGEEPYRAARVAAKTACEFLMVDPLDIEFAPVQLRLHVVEALLRGQVRRTLISSKPMEGMPDDKLSGESDVAPL